MKASEHLRTWIEIDARAARKNYDAFRKLVGPKVKLWSVVKSNAYGHGLFAFSELMSDFGIDGFCVDSIVEGVALRKAGIKKPILVLGQTLPTRFAEAAKYNITITVSTFEALQAKNIPEFHIKIDTGMRRQGFYPEELPRVIKKITSTKAIKSRLTGIYTHFASAKDINYPNYTLRQFAAFEKAAALFEKAGFKNLTRHVAATGGTLIDKKYHLDAVRVGIGLYGLWPSKELEMQLGGPARARVRSAAHPAFALHPVLSWRATLSEVKKLNAGDYVGYDLAERVPRAMQMAVVPIGYWHGFPRALSGTGEMIVRGKRARVIGRVSMDMTVIAPVPRAKAGDVATLIGSGGGRGARGRETILAEEQARKCGTTHYEFLTRLNPLIERIVV